MSLNPESDTSSTPTITGSAQRRGAVGVLDGMKRMLAEGEFSDVQFEVGRLFGPVKKFRAHKNILSRRSEVFYTMIRKSVAYTMIRNGVPETCPLVIPVPDTPPEAFANLLCYVYTDLVEGINADNVFPTLHCADKFGLLLLLDFCCDFIIKQLNADNCLATLEDANRWCPDFDAIVEKCLDVVAASSELLLPSEQFSSIGHKSLLMILERVALSADDNAVYAAVNTWALKTCEKRNLEPSAANRHEVLGPLLLLVHLPDAESPADPIEGEPVRPIKLPPNPRRDLQHRIGPDVYRHREAVFAPSCSGYWSPGEVVDTLERGVVIEWCRYGHMSSTEQGHVARAADILQRGQRVHCWGDMDPYRYCMRRSGKHWVEGMDGRGEIGLFVPFPFCSHMNHGSETSGVSVHRTATRGRYGSLSIIMRAASDGLTASQ
ncbi:uncharacterized protein LOC129600547 [Paramacrobiotus metropolitanus]|uniref:uncharacterized protein LOC129600547 n=1 Tax=Paramacrobiotus metropolitanus TaxID=2943436 RepID=UPI00244573A1|nr:uncharacterized protein LOC129600547 [Paramacrobiotus metropolitanus]